MVMMNGRNGVGKRMALVVLALAIFNYIILNTLHPGGLMAYVLPSTCWGFLALVALKASFGRIRSWFNARMSIAATSVAIFYVIILINIGLFTGFGRSVLSFTPTGLIINFTLVLTTLLGMEFSRAYLVKSFGRRSPFLTIGLVTLLYSFLSISMFKFMGLNDPLGVAKFLGVGLLPVIAENLLATYLAFVGGPVASLAYRGPLMAFWWFCPILPHLSWGVEALLGVMVPTVGFFVINQYTSPMALRRLGIPAEVKGFGRAKKSSLGGWMVAAVLCVLVVWVSTGLLGIRPTTVISGSMKPTMDVGDMAIVREVPADSIEVGDIIQYWNGGGMVIHRVVEFSGEGDGRLFVTKGDANQEPDVAPVYPDQVRGEVVLNIPKVGWAAIAVKSFVSGAWSFLTANPALTVLAIGSGVFIFYAFRMRKRWPTKKWKGPSWRRKRLGNGRLVAPLTAILIMTAATGLAYSCWNQTIYISGTVTTGTWGAEKTFILTVKYPVKLENVTYYGAVKVDAVWRSVELELTLDGYEPLCGHKPPPCENKIYTGTISGLPTGIYEWKIYYVDNLGENHRICSGTENLSGSVTNRCTLGCTSLEICKTVKCGHAEHENGYIYIIEGKIIVRNVGDYPAIVVDVSDTIEYRIGGEWRSLTPISFIHNVPEVIPLGGPYYYTYTCRFSTENILALGGYSPLCKPSWRNLIEITISNHPLGMHTFHDRADFKLGDG